MLPSSIFYALVFTNIKIKKLPDMVASLIISPATRKDDMTRKAKRSLLFQDWYLRVLGCSRLNLLFDLALPLLIRFPSMISYLSFNLVVLVIAFCFCSYTA